MGVYRLQCLLKTGPSRTCLDLDVSSHKRCRCEQDVLGDARPDASIRNNHQPFLLLDNVFMDASLLGQVFAVIRVRRCGRAGRLRPFPIHECVQKCKHLVRPEVLYGQFFELVTDLAG